MNTVFVHWQVQQSPQLAKHNPPLNHFAVDPPEKGNSAVRQQTTQILDLNQTPPDTAQQFDEMTPDDLVGNNRQQPHGN